MKRRDCVAIAVFVSIAGCASPPQSDPHYVAIENQIHEVVAHNVSHVPELIQTEAEIEGEHPLGYYVQLALGRNPEILAAQRSISAYSEVIPQVVSLDDPVLIDSFQPFDDHSVQTAAGRAPNTLMLSQKFPWYGKLETRGQIAEQDVQIAMTRLAQAELKVTEDVRLVLLRSAVQSTGHRYRRRRRHTSDATCSRSPRHAIAPVPPASRMCCEPRSS